MKFIAIVNGVEEEVSFLALIGIAKIKGKVTCELSFVDEQWIVIKFNVID